MLKNRILLSLFIILLFNTLSGQKEGFCPTYTFEGVIENNKKETHEIELNFLVLLDSTMVGSYHYKDKNIPFKLVGKLNKYNSFYLIERDISDNITGYFRGQITEEKDSAWGTWTSGDKSRECKFYLGHDFGTRYWDYINKHRGLYEYKSLDIAIQEFNSVQSIDVPSHGLSSLPDSLSKLKNILSINLLGNNFNHFPSVLTKMTSLNEISLSSNQLKSIGSDIGQLIDLRILIINNNQLKSLPKEIGLLTNLLYLEAGNNKLEWLPGEIKNLVNLQELHLERNNFSISEQKRIKNLLPNCVIYF